MKFTIVFLFGLLIPCVVSPQEQRLQLGEVSTADLLSTFVAVQDEFRARGVLKSGNSLTGDLAEHAFIKAFGWKPATRSQKGFDANSGGSRIQIKARRLSRSGGNEQLGAIRDLAGFDVLAAVLFDRQYRVVVASLIPVDVVVRKAKFNQYTNSYRLMYDETLRSDEDVTDVTLRLREIGF
ncbi:hypothetical protein [Sulfitobacter geojensis]|uniref:hypothetical protein n=1 Tax=Sulfitobacter geojensis TaxID=1342299 RepID=UPI003B8DDDB6